MLTHPELFRNDDVYWQEGRTVGGVAIGVIQRGGALVPMLPGNMGNGCTFPFAMLWDQMEGVTRDMVVA
uniref:hypothetical protein n=1 Tax=Bilophila wadsworthia TaxID=35833 RepID=UPI00242D9B27